MKTEIKVTALEHDELVNLLSTALYGSSWFDASYNKEIYRSLTDTHGDCFEDKLADMLLSGHKITLIDLEAEGEKYSNKCVGFEKGTENAIYEVGLKDFLKVASTKEGFKLLEEVLDGSGDYYTADAFLQRVVFGEEVYG
jgi:hypothetical protein